MNPRDMNRPAPAKKWLSVLLAVIVIALLSGFAMAEEGGSGHILPGSMASFTDDVPLTETIIMRANIIHYHGSVGSTKPLPIVGQTTLGADASTWGVGLTVLWRPRLDLGERWSYAMGDIVLMPLMLNYSVTPDFNMNLLRWRTFSVSCERPEIANNARRSFKKKAYGGWRKNLLHYSLKIGKIFPHLILVSWGIEKTNNKEAGMRQIIGAILAIMLVVTGCASTQEAKSVDKSGFLGDYSLLKEGERGAFSQGAENQALLVYKNPAADWRKYRKVILDPVTVWTSGKDSQLKDVSVEDRQRLSALLWKNFDESLRKDYEMTSQAGPDVMRIQAAITEAESSNAVLDTVTSIVPQTRLLSGMKSLATGVSLFTGSASVEVKITDTEMGTLLLAAVDRRGGTKSLSGVTNSWNDVEEAYRFWAEKARYRLCQWRGGMNCVEPKA